MNEQTRNEIISRFQQGQSQRGIARALNVSRGAVSRAIAQQQAARQRSGEGAASEPGQLRPRRTGRSLLDPFSEAIGGWLARYPNMTVERLLQELRSQGYQGGYTILRQYVKALRGSSRSKLVERFETGPGVQAQMDWGVYTLDFSETGRQRVHLFSYLLGYSRRQYLHFCDSQDLTELRREHVKAFEHLQGLAAECLYDNMKTVVDRWEDEAPLYNTRFLSFATHYGFRPRACRPARPQTKGKVERPFHYVEHNLLNGRSFRNLEHLNEVTAWWLAQVADVRQHRRLGKSPLEAWREEQPHLIAQPAQGYDTAQVVYRVVDVEGYISYQRNYYSVPWKLVGQTLAVRVSEQELIIYDSRLEPAARHALCARCEQGVRREERAHRPASNPQQQLAELKQRYAELGEVAVRFLEGVLQKQAYSKDHARKTLALLALYQRGDLLAAMERACRFRAYSWQSLERILAVQARPKTLPAAWTESYPAPLPDQEPIRPRPSTAYQPLLLDERNDEQDQRQEPQQDVLPEETDDDQADN